jgi:nifR3 family TIM-barrel protein
MPDFHNKVILAPLAGITETVFRNICKNHGADIVFSEMVSAEGILHGSKNTKKLLAISGNERPVAIQIFGSDSRRVADAARLIEEHAQPDFIDLNSGCPVPKVIKKNGGAALLKNPALFTAILTQLVRAVSVPVTVKIRSGWNMHEWIDVEYAKIAQDCGAAAVILHPRSKTMMFSGVPFRERIAIVKQAVSIPVIGNGDITTPAHADEMFALTGCDAVMIGRGALGNPWIFGQIRQLLRAEQWSEPSFSERVETAALHLESYISQWGAAHAAREMKKHLAWYFKGFPGVADLRNAIFRAPDVGSLRKIIDVGSMPLNTIKGDSMI